MNVNTHTEAHQVQLDQVLTVAIGDICTDGTRLDDLDWSFFGDEVRSLLDFHGTIVAEATGIGTTSDQDVEQAERTRLFVAVNVHGIAVVRKYLAEILVRYGQSSAAFAWDTAHEPCFATASGFRPIRDAELVR